MNIKTILLIGFVLLLVWVIVGRANSNPTLGIATMGNGNGASKTVAGQTV